MDIESHWIAAAPSLPSVWQLRLPPDRAKSPQGDRMTRSWELMLWRKSQLHANHIFNTSLTLLFLDPYMIKIIQMALRVENSVCIQKPRQSCFEKQALGTSHTARRSLIAEGRHHRKESLCSRQAPWHSYWSVAVSACLMGKDLIRKQDELATLDEWMDVGMKKSTDADISSGWKLGFTCFLGEARKLQAPGFKPSSCWKTFLSCVCLFLPL